MEQIKKENPLFKTGVDIEATGLVYSITSDLIATFVAEYLDTKQIKGLDNVIVKSIRDGATRPEIGIYAFFDLNSEDFNSSKTKNIPDYIQQKMSVEVRIGDKLRDSLAPMCDGPIKIGRREQNLAVIKLNEFKVLGLMLNSIPRIHELIILEVNKIPRAKGSSLLTVIKRNRVESSAPNRSDNRNRYDSLINNMDNGYNTNR